MYYSHGLKFWTVYIILGHSRDKKLIDEPVGKVERLATSQGLNPDQLSSLLQFILGDSVASTCVPIKATFSYKFTYFQLSHTYLNTLVKTNPSYIIIIYWYCFNDILQMPRLGVGWFVASYRAMMFLIPLCSKPLALWASYPPLSNNYSLSGSS